MKKFSTIIVAILILAGTVFQGVAMFRSGQLYSYGVGYFGPLARDGVWHEAIVGQLGKAIPPLNPGFSGQILTNYHYFYDILVAKMSSITMLPVTLLIYRLLPIIFSVLLGIGTYKLADLLFKDKKISLIAVFFAYFASSFGWVVSLVKGQQIGGESAFWANQPVSMNLNPPYAISLVILIFIIFLLDRYLKKPNIIKGVVLSVTIGLLIGFKAYAGAIALSALFLLTIKKIFFDRNFNLLPILIFSGGIFLAVFLSIGRGGAGLIGFQPLWLINTMIDAGDRVGIPSLSARRFAYLGSHQWIKLSVIEIVSFLIFFIGNLGTRIIGIFGLKKEQLKNDLFIFVFALMLASFIPPLVFVQEGNPWNVVQFFYYFMYFAGLFAAFGLRKIPLAVAVMVILITPISSIATFRSWLYPNPPAFLPTKEYEALKFLSNQRDGVVLKHPFDQNLRGKFKDPYPLSVYADNAYVSAYSEKSVYVEDVEQQIVLNTDYKTRLANANRFFSEKDLRWSNKFLIDNNIRYVYISKIYQFPMAEQEYSMTKIFENDGANIYEVIQK